jgi:hypothetical protein
MNMKGWFFAIPVCSVLFFSADACAQESAKVQITVTISAQTLSFTDQRLVISLFHDFPLQDDRGNRTVDRHIDAKFSHQKGKATVVTVTLGEKVKRNPGVQYFVDVSVFTKDSKLTHTAEFNGSEGPFPVFNGGSPRKVMLTVRPIR